MALSIAPENKVKDMVCTNLDLKYTKYFTRHNYSKFAQCKFFTRVTSSVTKLHEKVHQWLNIVQVTSNTLKKGT